MTAFHEDDLRAALHQAKVGVTLLETSVELAAHELPNEREVTGWRDRFLSSLSAVFGSAICPAQPPECKACRDTGRIAEDVPCSCPEADRYRAVRVAAPVPEVKRAPSRG